MLSLLLKTKEIFIFIIEKEECNLTILAMQTNMSNQRNYYKYLLLSE